ncbi:MAG: nucleotidyltransferase domain-containing protein, partial [Ilumatobacteraceae bacterium]
MDLPIDIEALRRVLRDHGVTFAFVFGSHADGTAGPSSDVDLAVWSEQPIDDWQLRGELPDVV